MHLLVFSVLLAVGSARRVKTATRVVDQTDTPNADTSPECPGVAEAGKPCQGFQAKRCPNTCRQIAEKLDQEPKSPGLRRGWEGKLSLLAEGSAIEALTMQQKMRLGRDEDFKRIWPLRCDGTNIRGEPLNIDVDGFACSTQDMKIKSVVDPLWMTQTAGCFEGQCHPLPYKGQGSIPVKEAIERAANAVARLQTDSGELVNVRAPLVKLDTPSGLPPKDEEVGVKIIQEVEMLDTNLNFAEASDQLLDRGDDFLKELSKPLSAMLSMQFLRFAETDSNLRVLLCAHGTTTAQRQVPGGRKVKDIDGVPLPLARANKVAKRLQDFVHTGGQDAFFRVGQPHAHYKGESMDPEVGDTIDLSLVLTEDQGGFKGERFAAIIIKIFDLQADVAEPECRVGDLWLFHKSSKSVEESSSS